MSIKFKAAVAASVAGLLTLSACGGDSSAASGEEIDLVAYSTPQTAFKAIEGLFQDTPEGKDVTFKESYGPSGDQSRAVEAGQPADFVNIDWFQFRH